ncbi:MAG: carboxypeptidase-like regulatory domain-containing protein [Chitinophagaceae bacterium]|nr:carboxypeptidase-like regulatory domain-containing protein [Chitinophagaceae bacterium]
MAQIITGQVTDSSGKPLSFATIKFGNSKEGIIANLAGKFSLKNTITFIEVSHTGYTSQRVEVSVDKPALIIILRPSLVNMEEVVIIASSGNKLKRILNSAIANRNIHNPDKYNWYQCNVYYKMMVDIEDPYFGRRKDSSRPRDASGVPLPSPYIMLTETYSKRTWQKPANLQEQIIASRMSGFTKPLLSSLITDILPFHAYDDFINLNGKDFHNPVSKGLYQRFSFKLIDEIEQQADTTWIIKFQPKLDPADLTGTVYITSDGFAITHIIAHSLDNTSKKDIGIEQQYAKYNGRWFPQQLNYILQWQIGKEDSVTVKVKGMSVIDSVNFKMDSNFSFDKAHTIKIKESAGDNSESIWMKLRPTELSVREQLTYHFMDSAFKKGKIQKLTFYATKLLEGKFPAGIFDIDINRLYSNNVFENNRVGWGMQTNEKLSKAFSTGGWAAYGTRDKQWKYGAFAEVYADRLKEFVINISYAIDLRDPGRLQINKDIDNNTLRMFLLSRADKVESWNVSIKKKLGYMNLQIAAGKEEIHPQYNYAFVNGGKVYRSFSIGEASLNMRYAFGETSAPFFGKYYSNGTGYPVLYSRIITGKITNANIDYTQAIAAISWSKNINRFGKEQFLLSGGISYSREPLPLSKLFAGNGFFKQGISVYAFGAMETILPYQFYSDRFINFYWLHQFNRSIFRLPVTDWLTIAPKPAIAYNVLYGSLKNSTVHQNVIFSVPGKSYHEGALMLNSVLRFKILGLYDATLNIGYFHHLPFKTGYPGQDCLVYGIGVEL